MYILASTSKGVLTNAYNVVRNTLNADAGEVSRQIFQPSAEIPFSHFNIMQFDAGTYIVYQNDDGDMIVEDGETFQTSAVCRSVNDLKEFVEGINNSYSQMNDRNYSVNAGRRIARR